METALAGPLMMLHGQLMAEGSVDPLACAVFLTLAFILAGIAQTVWLRSPFSQHFAAPLDFGRTCRGQRIFGDNKTLRGFVVMLPATAGSFLLLGFAVFHEPQLFARLWPLSPPEYAFLGLLAGLGFMIGELPNSFLKRQLGIQPGETPRRWPAKIACFALDRIDSIVGVLLVVSLVVPTPWQTWLPSAGRGGSETRVLAHRAILRIRRSPRHATLLVSRRQESLPIQEFWKGFSRGAFRSGGEGIRGNLFSGAGNYERHERSRLNPYFAPYFTVKPHR